MSASAARGLRSQSQIAAQAGSQYFVRLPTEHAIWGSEVRLKGAAGDKDTQCLVPDTSNKAISELEFGCVGCRRKSLSKIQ